jgi:hypothetical protein
MQKVLERETRENDEAAQKADKNSALRQAKIDSANATWPGKQIGSYSVPRVCIHGDGRACTALVPCRKHFSRPALHVFAPTDSTEEQLRNIAVVAHNREIDKRGVPHISESDSEGGGYRRRSRRRGRKLRKRTRKH